jgi:phosphoadenosine phosphosulfate reductase
MTPESLLRWADKEFAGGLALACSFGGPSGMVLVDMAARLPISAEVFYLDTGFLFPETHALVERVRKRYGITPVAYKPGTIDEPRLWETDPDRCCALRKVEPSRAALRGKRAWITGIRRDQTEGRAEIEPVEWDAKFGLTKLNPLADWTEEQVWAYIHANDVPNNALHDQGYPSIGCTHCTSPVGLGDALRAGRWPGMGKTECGLHVREQ